MEISLSEARERLSDLVNEAAFGKKYFILKRRGKRLAALVPIEMLEQMVSNKAVEQESNKTIKE